MAISSVLSAGIAGLQAASRHAESAASNIANATTADFTASRTVQQTLVTGSTPGGGTAVDAQILSSNGAPDLATEIVRLTEAEAAYKASASVIRTAEELAKEAIDIGA